MKEYILKELSLHSSSETWKIYDQDQTAVEYHWTTACFERVAFPLMCYSSVLSNNSISRVYTYSEKPRKHDAHFPKYTKVSSKKCNVWNPTFTGFLRMHCLNAKQSLHNDSAPRFIIFNVWSFFMSNCIHDLYDNLYTCWCRGFLYFFTHL